MPYPANPAALAQWCVDRRRSVEAHRTTWDMYDNQIVAALAVYALHLRGTGGVFPISDWRMVKAQIWVESSAMNPAWYTAPMQIGVNGDPGLKALLTTPHGKLILPQQFALALQAGRVAQIGNLNIIAGIGYLLQRLAVFNWRRSAASVLTPTPQPTHRSHHGHHHASNPASTLAIVAWQPYTLQHLAGSGYNGGGDGNYAGKLQFTYDLARGIVAPAAASPQATGAR